MSFSNDSSTKVRDQARRQPQKVVSVKYDSLQSLKSNTPSNGKLVRTVSKDNDSPAATMSSLSLDAPLSHWIHLFYDPSLASQHTPDLGSNTEYEVRERGGWSVHSTCGAYTTPA